MSSWNIVFASCVISVGWGVSDCTCVMDAVTEEMVWTHGWSSYPVMDCLRSDWLERLPATRQAMWNKDGKLQENNRAWAAASVSQRNNLQTDERHQIIFSIIACHFHYCCGQLHKKICLTHQMTKTGKPWMLMIDLRLVMKQYRSRIFLVMSSGSRYRRGCLMGLALSLLKQPLSTFFRRRWHVPETAHLTMTVSLVASVLFLCEWNQGQWVLQLLEMSVSFVYLV